MKEYEYVLDRFAGIVAGTLVKLGRLTMKDTIMTLRVRKGFSVHNATIGIIEEEDGSRVFSITAHKDGTRIEVPWEDVLEAGMEFVKKVAEE